jgi:hypothetical protein
LHNQPLARHQFAHRRSSEQADVGIPNSEAGGTVLVCELDVTAIWIAAGWEHSGADGRDADLGASSCPEK